MDAYYYYIVSYCIIIPLFKLIYFTWVLFEGICAELQPTKPYRPLHMTVENKNQTFRHYVTQIIFPSVILFKN